jgi:hypothetical protein
MLDAWKSGTEKWFASSTQPATSTATLFVSFLARFLVAIQFPIPSKILPTYTLP